MIIKAKKESKRTQWILCGLGLILINVILTQTIAHTLNYSSVLGQSYWRLYWPWMWMIWDIHYHQYYPDLFITGYKRSIIIILIFKIMIVMIWLEKNRSNKGVHNLHGSAAFADKQNIIDAGLLSKEKHSGVFVGSWQDGKKLWFLRHDGPEHVLAFAPTRSGKGVGLVIPTLLTWPHSAVILDIKGENWDLTAGWRQKEANNVVLRFDPSSVDNSVSFNPLNEIRLETKYEVSDVQNIVSMIVDPDGKGHDDHWSKTGHALLVGAILYCMYLAKKTHDVATLKMVADLLSDPNRRITDVFDEMIQATWIRDGGYQVIAASARDMLNKSENERSGVLSTAMSFLTLYRDPIVAANTATSDFRIRDLMNYKHPVSLYLIIRPSDKNRLKPIVRLILNQIIRILIEDMTYTHRLLLMLDEFPSLGRFQIFEEALAYIAGYGIKAYLITQDLSQLYGAYGHHESILANCHIRVAYAPNKIETARLLSEMLGVTTVVKKNMGISYGGGVMKSKRYSEHFQETKRPLLTPDECMTLPGPTRDSMGRITKPGDMLVFCAGHRPIYGKQVLYFTDKELTKRSTIATPNRLQTNAK